MRAQQVFSGLGGAGTVSHRTPLVCFVAAVPEQYSHLRNICIVLGVTVNLDFEVHHRMWAVKCGKWYSIYLRD